MLFEDKIYDFQLNEIINIVELSPNTNWKLNHLRYTDQWVLSYVINGDGLVYHMNEQDISVQKNSMLFFPEEFERSAICSANEGSTRIIVLKFRLQMANEVTNEIFQTIPNYIENVPLSIAKMFQEISKTWSQKRPGYAIKCKGLVYELLYELLNQSYLIVERHQYEHQLYHVMQAIETDISKHYTVKELADMAMLSPSYFQLIFKQFTGYSPNQYQNFIRMSYARDLILSEHYSIGEVANLVGFSDTSYFCRLFKKIIGVTPTQVVK
ncbi:AraC family transcriptional regulator [Chakrabartyella piscis]|uniref:helix-turn-helix transcriptional regulator n=1 Tax=Chakrabartyella piscis TaxID=2918914 RepID=UPI0029587B2C|nr:AraC family transcriptional regulator [Chakrabartyella piscis]